MKANEVPERIYVHIKDKPFEITFSEVIEKECSNIEYIKKDAFIEKACKYLFENYHGEKLSLRMIEDFKNYMKGE